MNFLILKDTKLKKKKIQNDIVIESIYKYSMKSFSFLLSLYFNSTHNKNTLNTRSSMYFVYSYIRYPQTQCDKKKLLIKKEFHSYNEEQIRITY